MKKIAILLSLIVSAYGGNVLNVPATYTTIQAGIDAASNGDTVSVATGTYTENIDFNGKNIVVMGEDKETTIIDGNKAGSVVTMSSGEPVTAELNGFTIQNGLLSYGAGIKLSEGKGTLKNLILTKNYNNVISSSRELICENVLITGNSGSSSTILVGVGKATIKNVVIVENMGSAINTQNSAVVEIINSTFGFNNSTSNFGGSNNNSSVNIINSIIYEPILEKAFNKSVYSKLSISYSSISTDYSGTGNIVNKPQFVNTDTTGGKKRDYHLSDYSPAIGVGTTTDAPSTDIEGTIRPNPAGSNPDMGAYESKYGDQQNRTIHVSTNGDSTANGDSTHPLESIQRGISMAIDGDTVLVAAGTYTENINFNGKNISVVGDNRETTIIDGNQSGSVVTVENGEDSTAMLSGFKIINGYAKEGGGIYCSNSNPRLTDLIIKDNTTHANSPYGGGIYFNQCSNVVINRVSVSNNYAHYGGGIYGFKSTVDIKNSEFYDGPKDCYKGEAIYSYSSSFNLNNTIIAGFELGKWNKDGGIFYGEDNSYFEFVNSNIVNNNYTAITLYNQSKVVVVNSIVYNKNDEFLYIDMPTIPQNNELMVHYSNIRGGRSKVDSLERPPTIFWGNGNIDVNPNFVNVSLVDTVNSDYHLSDYSQLIGAGTLNATINNVSYNYLTTDIEGNPRPNPAGSNPDMGAYENKWGTPQNAPPVITTMSDVIINEDESYSDTLRATDEEGDAITYSVVSDTSAVTVSVADSIFTVTPTANWNGVANITAYASDGYSKDSTSFKLTVTPVNDAPTLTEITETLSTDEETVMTVPFKGEDVDGDDLTYAYASDTSGVAATHNTAKDSLILTPVTDFFGNVVITVTVSDASLSDTSSFTLNVININDAPVMSGIQNQTINEDEVIAVNLTATDLDGDALTYNGFADTSVVKVTASNDTLKLTPKADWNGTSVIIAIVSDGTTSDSTLFNLTVNPVQDVPSSFNWVSSALDTINISQSNLNDNYTLQWSKSTDVDGDSIDYLVSAKIGIYPAEEIYDTTVTTLPLSYQEIVENVFEGMPNERATVRFSVSATDGIDTVIVTGDDRVLFVNRYDYLSTEDGVIPSEYALHENYPNPFNPITSLRFDLPEVSDVTVTIYNMLGQSIRTFSMNDTPAGFHSIKWDATNDYGDPVGAGVYLYQLRAGEFVKTKKMVLLK